MSKFVKKIFVVSLVLAFALSLTACGVNITSVGLPTDLTLDKGATEQLAASYGTEDEATEDKIAEAAAKLTLEWVSSDENVVTVDQAGLVTAVGPGEADVTVSIKDGNLQSVCHITVNVPLEGLEVENTAGLVINGEDSMKLDHVLTPADATDVSVAYSSSDETVATVSADGVITAVGNGECVVTTTATADGAEFKAETAVKVDTAPVSLSLEDTTLTVGYSGSLSVSVEGEDITVGTNYTWSSSDESIVTVDEEGSIKGAGIGSATVTATNDVGQSVSCDVTVKNIVCAYCGQEGHGSGSCPKKAADEKAAAEAARVAAEQAAAAAAQGGAGGGAGGSGGSAGGSSGGSSGGWSEMAPGGGQTIIHDGSAPENSGAGSLAPVL